MWHDMTLKKSLLVNSSDIVKSIQCESESRTHGLKSKLSNVVSNMWLSNWCQCHWPTQYKTSCRGRAQWHRKHRSFKVI